MECLNCGDCCLRLSPLTSSEPCPLLVKDENFYFCSKYNERPNECKEHRFNGFRFCPIGIEKLKLTDPIQVSTRIDKGWNKIKEISIT